MDDNRFTDSLNQLLSNSVSSHEPSSTAKPKSKRRGLNRSVETNGETQAIMPKRGRSAPVRKRLRERKIQVQRSKIKKPVIPPKSPKVLLASLQRRVKLGQGNTEGVKRDFAELTARHLAAAIQVAKEGMEQARLEGKQDTFNRLKTLLHNFQSDSFDTGGEVTAGMLSKLEKLPQYLGEKLKDKGLSPEVIDSASKDYQDRDTAQDGLMSEHTLGQSYSSKAFSGSTHSYRELFKLQRSQIGAALDVVERELHRNDNSSLKQKAHLRKLKGALKGQLRTLRHSARLKGEQPP